MRAYNPFRRKGEADLCCAVPQNVFVPKFVTDETWECACPRVDLGRPTPRHGGSPATCTVLLLPTGRWGMSGSSGQRAHTAPGGELLTFSICPGLIWRDRIWNNRGASGAVGVV
jgi:hypothetical protein